MREIKTTGNICLDDELGFTYQVAKLVYTEYEDETFKYEFMPNYSVISLLPTTLFQGIPGLDLDLKKEVYVRKNQVPVFISERTPSANREDLWVLLEAYNMDYLNRLEWLVRTDLQYAGDPLYASRKEVEDIEVKSLEELGSRSAVICHKVLEVLCMGGTITTESLKIDDSNRKDFFEVFMTLYRKERKFMEERRREGIKKSAKKGAYRGRSRIAMDEMKLQEVFLDYEEENISSQEAADRLQVSKSTFHRRFREYQKGLSQKQER